MRSQENRSNSDNEILRTFFGISALLSTLVMVTLLSLLTATAIVGSAQVEAWVSPRPIQAIGLFVGTVGAVAAIALWICMLWHSASSRMNPASKIAWILALIFGNWVVAPIYYVLCYRRRRGANP